MYEKLKLKECSNIIQNKERATLAVCNYDCPYQELIFYDTDCFCGCLTIYFKVCKCGELIKHLNNNDNVSLLITNNCNYYIETVELEGTIDILEDEVDCCCKNKNDCFKKVRFNLEKVNGKRYCK